ncbi:MAG: hypothetical protein ABJF88_13480 [Rhodothermales bacterium]
MNTFPVAKAAWLLALLLSGCAHTIPFDNGAPEERAAVNERAKGQQATVTLRDGQRLQADALRIATDSTSWLEPEARQVRTVATGGIESISFPTGGRHAGEGFAIGFGSGAALGYVVGLSTYEGPDIVISSRGDSALAGALLFAGLGGLTGLLIGYGSEARDVFELTASTDSTALHFRD